MEYNVNENYFPKSSLHGKREPINPTKMLGKYNPEIEASILKDEALSAKYVGFFALFRYANVCDIILMSAGILFAIISGVLFPLLVYSVGVFYIFGFDIVFDCSIDEPQVFFSHSFGLHLSLGFIVTSCAYYFCFMWAAKRQLFRVRIAYMDSIIRKDFSFVDTYIDRDLALRATNDVTELRYGMGENVPKIIFYFEASLLLLALAIYMDHDLAGITVLSVPLIAVIAYLRTRASDILTRKEQHEYRIADSVAAEILSCIKAIKVFQGEHKELSRFANALYSPLRLWKSILIAASASGAMWLVTCLQAAIFLIFILHFDNERSHASELCVSKRWWVIKDAYGHYPQLLVVYLCILFASIHCANIPPLILKVRRAQKIAAEIFFMIDWVPRIDNLSDTGEKPRKQAIGKLEMINVNFRYPRKPTMKVLSNVSFTIYPGQIVTFFGQQGDGKSTVIRLLLRLYDVCSGKYRLDGVDVEQLNVGWLRSQIGVIPQDCILFDTTIEENVRFGKRTATFDDIVNMCKKTGVHSDIMSFPEGYQTKVGSNSGVKLTDLQIKMISLARVFLQNPRIFILDNMIADLEEDFAEFVLQLFQEYREKCTIVLTSDKCNSIVKNSDVIFAMKAGKIVEMGNHEFLFAKEGVYFGMLQETLEENFGHKPNFTSQLISYKFAAAITRRHDFHDNVDTGYRANLEKLIEDTALFDSTYLRHVDPNYPYRLIEPRIIGGFQRYQYNANFQTNIHYFKNLVRSKLLRERDLRQKLLERGQVLDFSATPRGSISPTPVNSDRSDSDQLLRNKYVQSRSPSKTKRPSKWKLAMYNVFLRSESLQDQERKNKRLPRKSVQIQDFKNDDETTPTIVISRSMTNKEDTMEGHNKKNSTFSSAWSLDMDIMGDVKLQHYLGWSINSSPDNESISSEDSVTFWNFYNNNLQLAALTSGVKINSTFGQFLSLARFSWPYLVFAIFTSFIIGLCSCAIIFQEAHLFPAYVVHAKSDNQSTTSTLSTAAKYPESFIRICENMMAISAVAAFLAFVQELILGFGSCKSNNSMRKQLFSDFLRQDLQWFDYSENNIEFLCNSLAADTAYVQMALQFSCTVIAQSVAITVVSLWVFFHETSFYPEVFYMLPLIPVAFFFGYFEESMLGKYNSMVGAALKKPSEIQFEVLTKLQHVIMLNLEYHFTSQYIQSLKSGYGIMIRLFSVWRPLGYGLCAGTYFFLFHAWLQISWNKLKSRKDFVSFYIIGDLFMTGFFQIGGTIACLPSINSMLSVAELILSCHKNVKRKEALDRVKFQLPTPLAEDPPPEIQLHDVDFSFPVAPDVFMLKQITFKIESMEYVAVVGPVKSGKSALVDILLNLYFPTTGDITMNSKKFTEISDKSIRSLVGLVEQDPTFLNLTLAECIAYGDNSRNVTDEEIKAAAKLANIDNIISTMEHQYQTKLGDLIEGSDTFVLRQRLAVARVAINNPKILVVDEATTSIDNKNYELLNEALNRLRQGRTYIVISQRIEPIRTADTIIVLQNGSIAEMGSDVQLMANKGPYYEIYMSQKLFERNRTHHIKHSA